jgi:Lipoprotein signal peptidase
MIFLLIAIVIFIADFIIKDYIERNKKENDSELIIKDKVILRKVYNKGIMFNIGEDKAEFITGLSVGVFAIVLFGYIHLLLKNGYGVLKLGASFVIGGAASNIYDRLMKKKVVDYFSINTKVKKIKQIVFNISDWFIFLGAIIIFISQIRSRKEPK